MMIRPYRWGILHSLAKNSNCCFSCQPQHALDSSEQYFEAKSSPRNGEIHFNVSSISIDSSNWNWNRNCYPSTLPGSIQLKLVAIDSPLIVKPQTPPLPYYFESYYFFSVDGNRRHAAEKRSDPSLPNDKQPLQFPPGKPGDKPKLEHLKFIEQHLTHEFPRFFHKMHPYALYTPDVVFENNLTHPPKVYRGVLTYCLQLTWLRTVANWRYAFLKMRLLNVNCNQEEGTVSVRWRVEGFRARSAMIRPWSFKLWKKDESLDKELDWIDGFSSFYVRGDGRISKHRMDKVIPDEQKDVKVKEDLAAKLAAA